MIPFERQKIIKIPRDSAHREIARGDLDSGEARNIPGKNGRLNLLRNCELFLNRGKTLLLSENAVRHEVTQAAYKSEKSERFNFSSRQKTESMKIRVNHENSENSETHSNDAEFAGETARPARRKQVNRQEHRKDKNENAVGLIDRPRGGPNSLAKNCENGKCHVNAESPLEESLPPLLDDLNKQD